MTEEQVKFMFNFMYRYIGSGPKSFGELLFWAKARKIDDDTFLNILDYMEKGGFVSLQGETYSVIHGSRAG